MTAPVAILSFSRNMVSFHLRLIPGPGLICPFGLWHTVWDEFDMVPGLEAVG